MKDPVMTEKDMGAHVVEWLKSKGWDVYEEVVVSDLGTGRADIVGVKDKHVLVVECKMQLSFDLLAQGERWLKYANEVWVAVPAVHQSKTSEGRQLAFRVAGLLDMGLLEVRNVWPVDKGRMSSVEARVEAHKREWCRPELYRALKPEHKQHAKAGESGGGHFTDFKATIAALVEVAKAEPGIRLSKALARVPHQYTSIRNGVQALKRWYTAGLTPGLLLDGGDDEEVCISPDPDVLPKEKKILRNRCKCSKCGDVIESRHRHEFVKCKCGATFTDGGKDYIRRGFSGDAEPIDMSEYLE